MTDTTVAQILFMIEEPSIKANLEMRFGNVAVISAPDIDPDAQDAALIQTPEALAERIVKHFVHREPLDAFLARALHLALREPDGITLHRILSGGVNVAVVRYPHIAKADRPAAALAGYRKVYTDLQRKFSTPKKAV